MPKLLIIVSSILLSYTFASNGESIFNSSCLSCHNAANAASTGLNIFEKSSYQHGTSKDAIFNNIKNGLADYGMPAFGDGLSDNDILAVVNYIEGEASSTSSGLSPHVVQGRSEVFNSDEHNFRFETLYSFDGVGWSIDALPDGSLIGTEKSGKLLLFKNGNITEIKGVPEVLSRGQGGMLEVAVHPDYQNNGFIYLAYTHAQGSDSMTKVVRGKIKNKIWSEQNVIYQAPEDLYKRASRHFGTRIAFRDGYLFFTIGDRGSRDEAQDLSLPNGKVHRLHDDGSVPEDNPFVNRRGALSSIYTYGNRNPQGLDFHPTSGQLWSSEHGPRGGDEINIIEKGNNYGWPVITYGINYSGTKITDLTQKEGMEQPAHYWSYSPAVCGIDFYTGNTFEKWKNNLFVASLAQQEFHRLEIVKGNVTKNEIVFKGRGRIRDVLSAPNDELYILFNRDQSSVERLVLAD